ncbi:hypothetical protein LINPERPRIM_LOCUS32093 [Linum perenne]
MCHVVLQICMNIT